MSGHQAVVDLSLPFGTSALGDGDGVQTSNATSDTKVKQKKMWIGVFNDINDTTKADFARHNGMQKQVAAWMATNSGRTIYDATSCQVANKPKPVGSPVDTVAGKEAWRNWAKSQRSQIALVWKQSFQNNPALTPVVVNTLTNEQILALAEGIPYFLTSEHATAEDKEIISGLFSEAKSKAFGLMTESIGKDAQTLADNYQSRNRAHATADLAVRLSGLVSLEAWAQHVAEIDTEWQEWYIANLLLVGTNLGLLTDKNVGNVLNKLWAYRSRDMGRIRVYIANTYDKWDNTSPQYWNCENLLEWYDRTIRINPI